MSENAVQALQRAESTLIAALKTATAALNQVGTSDLDSAMADYRAAVLAAQHRLADATDVIGSLALEVSQFAQCIATDTESLLTVVEPQSPQEPTEAAPTIEDALVNRLDQIAPQTRPATPAGKRKGKVKAHTNGQAAHV
jgi:hypothetical protein